MHRERRTPSVRGKGSLGSNNEAGILLPRLRQRIVGVYPCSQLVLGSHYGITEAAYAGHSHFDYVTWCQRPDAPRSAGGDHVPRL